MLSFPRARPRRARSAALLREADPAVLEEAGEIVPALEHVVDGLHDVGGAREAVALSVSQVCSSSRSGALLSCRTRKRSSALRPLMSRSMSNNKSMRLTASSAIGEIAVADRPRRAFFAISASSKKRLLRAPKQKAGVIGAGLRLRIEEQY